jgi:molecular chaperone GrpE
MDHEQKQNDKNGAKNHDHHHDHGRSHEHPEKKVDENEKVQASPQPDAKTAGTPEPSAVHQAQKKEEQKSEHQKDQEKINELKSSLDAANDKYLRLMAEFDNFKRRTAKEYQQLIEQANEKLMKDLLEVRENFERAFKTHKEGADPKPFVDGMKMIFSKLDAVLHKHGLEVYSEAGQEFDPQLHDAMMKSAHETVPEHHIAEVCEKGYKLRGKVIKHSKVIVSSGKPLPDEEKKAEASCTDTGDETVFEVSVKPKEEGTTDDSADA